MKLKDWASCPIEELTVEMVLNDKSPFPEFPREEIANMIHRRLKACMHPRQESSSIIKSACDGIHSDFFDMRKP